MALNQAHRANLGRIVLSLFILAWGSASAAPCLMAMDSPNASTAMAAHGMHGEHASSHEDMPDCEHCPPAGDSAATLCAQGLNADCGVVPEANSDSRSHYQNLKSDAQPATLPGPRLDPFKPLLQPFYRITNPRRDKHITSPALTILNCVYLK